MMEVNGALNIFYWSKSTQNMYLSHGDSNIFRSADESEPYGDNVNIAKWKGVDNVRKRMDA
jgi:hypothetical protein